MTKTEVDLDKMLLQEIRRETNPASFLAMLHRFAQMYQHPAMLAGDAEALSAPELLAQSSKLATAVAKLHEIRGRREKVIIFARHRAMQGIGRMEKPRPYVRTAASESCQIPFRL